MKTLRIINICLALIIGLALVVGVAGMIILRGLGIHLLSVHGASMEPSFRSGDTIIVQPVNYHSLRPGDIVSFKHPRTGLAVTHRIRTLDWTSSTLTTAGDKTGIVDPSIHSRQLIGQATILFPRMGSILDLFKNPLVLVLLIYVPATAVIAGEIRKITSQFTRSRHLLDYNYDHKRQKA